MASRLPHTASWNDNFPCPSGGVFERWPTYHHPSNAESLLPTQCRLPGRDASSLIGGRGCPNKAAVGIKLHPPTPPSWLGHDRRKLET
jgi:hypothetical protein